MKEKHHYAFCPCYISLSITALSRTQQQSCYLWLCNTCFLGLRMAHKIYILTEISKALLSATFQSCISFALCFCRQSNFPFLSILCCSLAGNLHFPGSGYWPNMTLQNLSQFEASSTLIPYAREQGRSVGERNFSSSVFFALCFFPLIFSLKYSHKDT